MEPFVKTITAMLRGFVAPDNATDDRGVRCVLNGTAMIGFFDLIDSVYGQHALRVVQNMFTRKDNGEWVSVVGDDDPEAAVDAFFLCLAGRG